jgi:hypothetical protein
MNFAIPLAAVGMIYILSSQKNKNEQKDNLKEAFSQMHRKSRLPNMDKPVKNFPITDRKELEKNVNNYAGKKNTADNYYNPGNYETLQMSNQQTKKTFQSLTGDEMRLGEITHNNQVPYFGSSVTQSTTGNNEGLLDKYTGSGSQHIAKQSQAPLFKPQKNMAWSHGMPSTTSFMQQRMKSTLTDKMNNTKPWEEIRVGPGINNGYGAEGSGGFNSGMEGRDVWRPKNVDELRIATNPKVTYGGQVLGAYKPNQSGLHGKVEKNRPDTYFINSEDRWLTTTGIEKAQKARGTIALKPENRAFQVREHFGQSNVEANGTYVNRNYQRCEKPQFKSLNMGVATDKDGWEVKGQEKDMREIQQEGYRPLANARNLTKQQKELGPVSRGFKAMVTPLLDVLRPSRKQNVIGNMRPTGNAHGKYSVSHNVVWNPADKVKTTIKEQTAKTKYILQGGTKRDAGHVTNKHTPFGQHRDTTTTSYTGNSSAGAASQNARVYNAEYNAELNPNKQVVTKVDRFNQGANALFSGQQSVTNLRNRASVPDNLNPNFTKITANASNLGQMSGKNTRENSVLCGRNSSDMLSAFNKNPYSKPLNSVA